MKQKLIHGSGPSGSSPSDLIHQHIYLHFSTDAYITCIMECHCIEPYQQQSRRYRHCASSSLYSVKNLTTLFSRDQSIKVHPFVTLKSWAHVKPIYQINASGQLSTQSLPTSADTKRAIVAGNMRYDVTDRSLHVGQYNKG